MLSLENEQIRFQVDPISGFWQVQTTIRGDLSIRRMQSGAELIPSGNQGFDSSSIVDAEQSLVDSPLGTFPGIRLNARMNDGNVQSVLEFCLTERALLWRIQLQNVCTDPLLVDQLILMQKGKHSIKLGRGAADEIIRSGLHTGSVSKPIRMFVNGWQSWSPSGSYSWKDQMPRSRFGPFVNPMHNPFDKSTPHSRGCFHSDLFGVLGAEQGPALLIGFLSQKQAFGRLDGRLRENQADLRLWEDGDRVQLEEGESFSSDWAFLQPLDMNSLSPLSYYFDLLGRVNHARISGSVPVGWSSWYHYFQGITEKELLDNLDWLENHRKELPVSLVQLDDGYQKDIGDWYYFSDGFPDGPARAAGKIARSGFRPGIWLAPFIVRRSSELYRSHPGWMIRNARDIPVNAGFVWNSFTAGLDVSHPEVQNFASDLLRTAVEEWGFSYLKLDFLYAGVLKGSRYNQSQTRAQALAHMFQRLQDAVGSDVDLLGCGSPIGSSIGVFNIMRIGADVAPDWMPSFAGIHFPFRKEKVFPSARNSICSILTRMPMHRRLWVNDPDCVLVRENMTKLTEAEVQTLAVAVSFSAGAFIISDSLPMLSKDRMDLLKMFLPILDKPAVVLDWFDAEYPAKMVLPVRGAAGDWSVAGRINWGDQPLRVEICPEEYGIPAEVPLYVFDIWNREYAKLEPGQSYPACIEPHGIGLYAIRKATPGSQWVGDTLHISQGVLITEWKAGNGLLEAVVESGFPRDAEAWITIPGSVTMVLIDGVPVERWHQSGEMLHVLLELKGRHDLSVLWTIS